MYKKLLKIQSDLKAPKSQHNAFGNYDYRSCEDILEAVKPLLAEQELLLTISEEIVSIDGWHYVKAIAELTDGSTTAAGRINTVAYARETETRPKFDSAQLTGSASSYARKYALNGLFLIDDNKDPDTTNGDKPKAKLPPKPTAPTPKPKVKKPEWITKNKHSRLEALITQKLGKDGREKIREAIGNIRNIHPADKEFADIHLNQVTDAEYKAITDELNKREDAE